MHETSRLIAIINDLQGKVRLWRLLAFLFGCYIVGHIAFMLTEVIK